MPFEGTDTYVATDDLKLAVNAAIALARPLLIKGEPGTGKTLLAGDTRYSGSEMIVRKLTEMGADVKVHDPYLDHWWEFEAQDSYPRPGHSWGRFFHRQEPLKHLRLEKDLWAALKGIDALVLAVRHDPYLKLDPDKVVKSAGQPFAVVDCFCVLDDEKIRRYLALGFEVKGMGRGHIKRIKDSLEPRRSARKAK